MDQNRNDQPKNGNENTPKRPKKNILFMLVIAIAIVLIISSIYNAVVNSQYTQTTYSDFLNYKATGNLAEVEFQFDRIIYMTKTEAAKDPSMQQAFFTALLNGNVAEMAAELHNEGVTVNGVFTEDNSMIMMILYYIIMIAVIFGVMSMITRRMGSEGMMGGFGKSKAKVYMEKQTGVTFKDVAGQDEAKESLQEIIDFLHNP